jgi:hypothetical protein
LRTFSSGAVVTLALVLSGVAARSDAASTRTVTPDHLAQGPIALSTAPLVPADDVPLRFRERFLAANDNTDSLTLPQARAAGLVRNISEFDAVDQGHHGHISLEDVRRFVRNGSPG